MNLISRILWEQGAQYSRARVASLLLPLADVGVSMSSDCRALSFHSSSMFCFSQCLACQLVAVTREAWCPWRRGVSRTAWWEGRVWEALEAPFPCISCREGPFQPLTSRTAHSMNPVLKEALITAWLGGVASFSVYRRGEPSVLAEGRRVSLPLIVSWLIWWDGPRTLVFSGAAPPCVLMERPWDVNSRTPPLPASLLITSPYCFLICNFFWC